MSTPTFSVTRNPRNAGRKPRAFSESIGTQTHTNTIIEIGTQTHTNTIDIGTQTDYSPLESILSDLQLLPYDDLVYLFHNLFHNINDEDKVIHLFSLFENLDGENQETFFESLGGIFNEELSRATTSSTTKTKDLSMSQLLDVKKSDLFEQCDPRLKSFLISATEKSRDKRSDQRSKMRVRRMIWK